MKTFIRIFCIVIGIAIGLLAGFWLFTSDYSPVKRLIDAKRQKKAEAAEAEEEAEELIAE